MLKLNCKMRASSYIELVIPARQRGEVCGSDRMLQDYIIGTEICIR
jgi:hypothetical protein